MDKNNKGNRASDSALLADVAGLGKLYHVTYCPDCERQRREYMAWKRARSITMGLCRRCNKRKPMTGKPECVSCAAKKRVAYALGSKQRRRRLPITTNEFAERRQLRGLCLLCGCAKSDARRKLCMMCYDAERERNKNRMRSRRRRDQRKTTVVNGFDYLYGQRSDTANCRASFTELAAINHFYDGLRREQ